MVYQGNCQIDKQLLFKKKKVIEDEMLCWSYTDLARG